MKKVILFVALLLTGVATQAQKKQHQSLELPAHRYFNAQEILFVENGVLYKVNTVGEFNFKPLRQQTFGTRGRSNVNVNHPVGAPGHIYSYDRGRRAFVTTDRLGRIRTVGNSRITYLRNGKVKSIGSISMDYHRGRLIRVGGMELIYDRFGKIRRTLGSVNQFNHNFWHDDWYSYSRYENGTVRNDEWYLRNTRIRNKEI
ncbi:hypothetical protein [Altibacter sp. HG106]|uniref:hypothetical protein n=1 Tax=Altibacter sp. HG106 TaxID=3023937 RepID=UPI002350A930|nr:hypothetical protein [Altibacter sp. HG106]MDC7993669.1 hypothetical protein [Altibacter sp. HG106]